MERAADVRDRAWGKTLTFSPKVFLPVTNLCRNHCNYCSFRASYGSSDAHTMPPEEIEDYLQRGRAQGCTEALFCLGDWNTLHRWGHKTIVDYLVWAGERALEIGLLPHTNAGVLNARQMIELKRVNVSLGLMLENVSLRMCEPGMPHAKAPDKRPARRLEMLRRAGELKIPFTSGVLIGIGETRDERIDTLFALRHLHREFGHIQEVIVQNFRATPGIPMNAAPEPTDHEVADAIALARLIMPPDVGVQAPPNLNPHTTELLIRAGINDFGGISPVTPDFVNRLHPWPHVDALHDSCAKAGYELRPRLPIYDGYIDRPGFLESALRKPTEAMR